MQVILLEKLRNLGNLGDKVKVKRGHGRNYLIPQGKAIPASEQNIAKFETRRAELEKTAQGKITAAKERAEKLANLIIEIKAKAGDEGKLFGSVGSRDIVTAITDKGINVEKSEVELPNGIIRQTGEHEIFIQLHTDVRITVKVNVIPG